MAEPHPTLVLSSSERVMFRTINEDVDAYNGYHQWHISDPVPGVRIINTWEVYFNIWIILAKAENGHYQLFQTMDKKIMTLVHDHESEIYNLFWVDSGRMIFCAEDGWWETIDSGESWEQFSSDAPKARIAAVQRIMSNGDVSWLITAYADDHKFYTCNYPCCGDWTEIYDTNVIWSGKWYPALVGSPLGLLAGAGSKLLRQDRGQESWAEIGEVDGIIKNIIISNQSNMPTFLIEVEKIDGSESKLYWSYDMGDSLILDMNRIGPFSSVQSVYPTASSQSQTMFAVLGRRVIGGVPVAKIIKNEGH